MSRWHPAIITYQEIPANMFGPILFTAFSRNPNMTGAISTNRARGQLGAILFSRLNFRRLSSQEFSGTVAAGAVF